MNAIEKQEMSEWLLHESLRLLLDKYGYEVTATFMVRDYPSLARLISEKVKKNGN